MKKLLRKIFRRDTIDWDKYEGIQIVPGEGEDSYTTIMHSMMEESPELKFYEALTELVALLPEIKSLLKQTKRDID